MTTHNPNTGHLTDHFNGGHIEDFRNGLYDAASDLAWARERAWEAAMEDMATDMEIMRAQHSLTREQMGII